MTLNTLQLPGQDLKNIIENNFPETINNFSLDWVEIPIANYLEIITWMKNEPKIDAAQLSNITGVDMIDSFEIHLHLQSLDLKKLYSMKVILDRENPVIPSLCDLYIGANLQEREIFDLLGINFDGHPDLRRIFLWEGFAGHPLRKDFMQMEDANPGLPRFPFEEEGKQER